MYIVFFEWSIYEDKFFRRLFLLLLVFLYYRSAWGAIERDNTSCEISRGQTWNPRLFIL